MCTAATDPPSPYRCTVNPAATSENQFRIAPVAVPKRVWVIGAGPGGLEAARVAGLRGHKVTLFEKSDKLGGQLNIIPTLLWKDPFEKLREYMVRQVEKAGVEVRLGEEVAADSVAEGKPDAVILAVGATPLVPDIPGIEGDNVVMVEEALAGVREVGDIVVIVGGGMVGCETAEFLHAKGKQVTILEMLPRVGDDIEVTNRLVTMTRLREAGIVMRANTKAVRITENGVAATSDGATEFFEGDTVVLAAGAKPRDELACELEGKVAALYSVGDCVEPRLIREAIGEGARAGLEL